MFTGGQLRPIRWGGERLNQGLKIAANMQSDTIDRQITVFRRPKEWLKQALRRCALQEVTGGAAGRGLEELITVLVGCKKNDWEIRDEAPQFIQEFNCGQIG